MPGLSSTFMRPTPIKPPWISTREKYRATRENYWFKEEQKMKWINRRDAAEIVCLYLWRNRLWSLTVEKREESRVSQSTSSQFRERFFRTVAKKNTGESPAHGGNYRNPETKIPWTHFVVEVEPAEISSFSRSSVAVSESALCHAKVWMHFIHMHTLQWKKIHM